MFPSNMPTTPGSGSGWAIVFVFALVPLVVFALLKTPIYFGIVRAFRYRVPRSTPLSTPECLALAVSRAVTESLLFAVALLAVIALTTRQVSASAFPVWLLVCAARWAVWWSVGRSRPGLRGRELTTFALIGVGADVALDVVMLLTLGLGLWFGAVVLAAILVVSPFVLAAVHRPELVERYAGSRCVGCGYDLCGNQLGYCPECGRHCVAESPIKYGDYDPR